MPIKMIPMTEERRLLVLNMCHLALDTLREYGRIPQDENDPPVTSFLEAVCAYGARWYIEPEEVRQIMREPLSSQFMTLIESTFGGLE